MNDEEGLEEGAEGEGEVELPVAEEPASVVDQPRRRRGTSRRTNGVGAWAASGTGPHFQESDAELLWGEMLEWFATQTDPAVSPYKMSVQVMLIDPGPPRLLGTFPAQAVMGTEDRSPGDMLHDKVLNEYHLASQQGPANYDIRFVWTRNTRVFQRGKMHLGAPEEINNIRMAAKRARAGRVPPPGAFLEDDEPPPPPPAGVRGPAPAGATEQSRLLYELSETRRAYQTLVNEVVRANREGRPVDVQAVPPPPAPAPTPAVTAPAPQPSLSMEEVVTRAVGRGLEAGFSALSERLGMAKSASAPASPMADQLRGSIEEMVSGVVKSATSMVGDTIRKSLTGVGAPPPQAPAPAPAVDDDDEPPEEPEPPPQPGDNLPFQVDKVPGATWSDGRPVNFARNKETGNVAWGGLPFANPIVIEKGMEMGSAITGKVGDAAERVMNAWAEKLRAGLGGRPQVVDRTPSGAVDGTPHQQAATPPPNGGGRGGWPSA